eukprot:s6567_g4.t1
MQHDATELLVHLLRKGSDAPWVSRWQAGAQLGDRFEIEDSGSSVILMPIVSTGGGERCTLQECVNDWQSRPSQLWEGKTCLYCISEFETHVCIALQRFRVNAGAVTKCLMPVQVDATCDLPVFRAGAITWQTFRVCAVTYHIGEQPTCGHYRSILYLSDGLQLVTEDRVKAKKLSAKERSASQAGNYIIYLSSNF